MGLKVIAFRAAVGGAGRQRKLSFRVRDQAVTELLIKRSVSFSALNTALRSHGSSV